VGGSGEHDAKVTRVSCGDLALKRSAAARPLRRARVRLRMAGFNRGEEWGQCKRVWSSLPTIWMGRQEGQ